MELPPPVPRIRLFVRDRLETVKNVFGIWHSYLHRPSYNPDSALPDDNLLHNVTEEEPLHDPPSGEQHSSELTTPGGSARTFELLTEWANTGSLMKSRAEVQRLVTDYFRHPEFEFKYFKSDVYNAARENKRLDAAVINNPSNPLPDTFQLATVTIDIPSGVKGKPPISFPVPGLFYRKLTSAITAAFTSPIGAQFHYTPFQQSRVSPTTSETERIYSELYNSDAFIEEHDLLQRRGELPPDDPNCKREKTIAAVMLWSDSTHLANFGMAKLWPIYLYLGNLSKYIRAKSDSGACQHVAYMPTLPDSLEDMMKDTHPAWKTQKKSILTHCRRELIHAVWRFLLDDDFIHACRYGIVILCPDSVERRVYPRIFTYSADYPEKYVMLLELLHSMRN